MYYEWKQNMYIKQNLLKTTVIYNIINDRGNDQNGQSDFFLGSTVETIIDLNFENQLLVCVLINITKASHSNSNGCKWKG